MDQEHMRRKMGEMADTDFLFNDPDEGSSSSKNRSSDIT